MHKGCVEFCFAEYSHAGYQIKDLDQYFSKLASFLTFVASGGLERHSFFYTPSLTNYSIEKFEINHKAAIT